MANENLKDWTDEALDAAISQLNALRFASGLTARERMKIILHAAERAEQEATWFLSAMLESSEESGK